MTKNDFAKIKIIVGVIVLIAFVVTGYNLIVTNTQIANTRIALEDSSRVNKIVLTKGEEEITLNKEADVWKLGDENADGEAINAFINALADYPLSDPVSTNKDNYSLFELGDEATGMVTIYDYDAKLVAFVLGKGSSGGGLYVRFDGDVNVYELPSDIYAFTQKSSEDLKSKPPEVPMSSEAQ